MLPPTEPDEARRRGLAALAEGLRRKRPGAIVEVADEGDGDAIPDRPATSADSDVDDHRADGA